MMSEEKVGWLVELLRRPVGLVLAVVQFALLIPVWNAMVPDSPPSGYALLMLGAVVLSLVEIEVVGRMFGWHVFFDLSQRATRLALGGLVLGVMFAGVLFAKERGDQASAAAHRAIAERRDEELKRLMRSPDVQRGMEVVRQQQAGADAAAGTEEAGVAAAPASGATPASPEQTVIGKWESVVGGAGGNGGGRFRAPACRCNSIRTTPPCPRWSRATRASPARTSATRPRGCGR